MEEVVLKIKSVSKQYRLGVIGSGTLSDDLKRWWYLARGKEDPFTRIGEKKVHSGDEKYVWALKDINVEVRKGEVLGIIGKNGAGKSTLLKLLSQVTTPTTGEIAMVCPTPQMTYDMTRPKAHQKKLSYTPLLLHVHPLQNTICLRLRQLLLNIRI